MLFVMGFLVAGVYHQERQSLVNQNRLNQLVIDNSAAISKVQQVLSEGGYPESVQRLERLEITANRIEAVLSNQPPVSQQQQIILPRQPTENEVRQEEINRMLLTKGWVRPYYAHEHEEDQ